MKKLPEILSKRLPTVLAMSFDRSSDDPAVFFVYFPVDLLYGLSAMMFQAKRKFRKIIREFLEAKGIKAEIK
jgi:small-conductance mechanosensitive channel